MAPKKKTADKKVEGTEAGFKYKVLVRAKVNKEIHEPGAIVILPERDLTSENENVLQFLGEVKAEEKEEEKDPA